LNAATIRQCHAAPALLKNVTWRTVMTKTMRSVAMLICLSTFALLPSAVAAMPTDNLLSAAVSAWQAGELDAAEATLAQLIKPDDRDPRGLFLRGIITEQRGADGAADFRAAADIEAALGTSRLGNQLLERVQGKLRARIEAARSAARVALKPDPIAAMSSILYADGLAALKLGDQANAIAAFDKAIEAGSRDARVFYMRGVALERQDRSEEAVAAFRDGLALEVSGRQIMLVSEALQHVQGDVRRLIEEQVTVDEGGVAVSRQDNRRTVMHKEQLLQQELLLADDEQRAQLMARNEDSRMARERAAAEQYLSAEEAATASPGLPNSTPETELTAPIEAPAAGQPTTPAVVANPFGGTTTSTVRGPAEAEAAPGNPFLTGAAGSTGGSTTRSSAAGTVDFAWLAPDSELLVYIRPGDLLASEFMQPIMNLPQVQGGIAQASTASGINPADIESVTVGLGNVMAVGMQAAMQAQGGGAAPVNVEALMKKLMEGGNGIVVIRTTTDIDVAPLAAAVGAESVDYNGKSYFRKSGEDDTQSVAVHSVDGRTFVVGSDASLEAALDRGPGSGSHPAFDFVSGQSHFAVAFASPMMAIMSGSMPIDDAAPPFVKDLTNAIRGKVAGSGLTITADNGLTIASVMSLSDAEAATAAAAALKDAVTQGQQMFPIVKGSVPPPLQTVADQVVASLSASSAGTQASISATIPGALITTLQENPDILQQLMMMGASGMGGGGPGAGNPSDGFGFPAEDPSGGNNTSPQNQ
jgi:Flp pilus assembly protein TadD